MAVILADNIFKCIFFNENDRIPIKIWLKLVWQKYLPISVSGNNIYLSHWVKTLYCENQMQIFVEFCRD